jgi:hypothetical protein
MSKTQNGKHTSVAKREIKMPIKKYAKIRAAPKFDLGFENLVKSNIGQRYKY